MTDMQQEVQTGNQGATPVDTGTMFDLGDDVGSKPAATEGQQAKPDGDKPVADTTWRSFANPEKDADFARFVGRYQSAESIARAAFNFRKQIASGEIKRALPADATPEQVSAWRKEQGLPEKPEGYEPAKVTGHEFGDADKPGLDAFRSVAHQANMTPQQFQAATEWYAKTQIAAAEQRLAADNEVKTQTEEMLRGEWGPEFRPTMQMTSNYLDQQLGEDKAAFLSARLPDGTKIGSHPNIVKFLAQIAREADGGVGLMRGDGMSAKGDEARLAEIRAMQHSDKPEVAKSYWSEAIQAEERQIYERQLKRQQKAA